MIIHRMFFTYIQYSFIIFYLYCSDGCAIFRQFVATEHSEENLDFWQLCEEFKRLKRGGEDARAAEKARQIFDLHLSTTADKEVLFVLISSFNLLISFFFEGQFGQ